MSKRLMALSATLLLAVGAFAFVKISGPELPRASKQIVSGSLNFNAKDMTDEHVKLLYELAKGEYADGNYGNAKDLFGAVTQISDEYPSADVYLGRIHAEVKIFEDRDLAKLKFVRIVNNDKSNSVQKQIAYYELAKLAHNPGEAFNYAKSSVMMGDSQKSRLTLAIAYGKLFEKTKDQRFVEEVVAVLKDPNTKIRVDSLLSSKNKRIR